MERQAGTRYRVVPPFQHFCFVLDGRRVTVCSSFAVLAGQDRVGFPSPNFLSAG